jgi:hypothetical protein
MRSRTGLSVGNDVSAPDVRAFIITALAGKQPNCGSSVSPAIAVSGITKGRNEERRSACVFLLIQRFC